MSEANRPIGVFDSGVGGLTVLRALRAHLPHESTVYLGDTARVPYGTRSARTVIQYALNNARFLMEAAELKLLVVACNTASAVAIEPLREVLTVPVIGVVEPGARAAAEASRGHVAVIGTRGTVKSGAYQRALAEVRPELEVVARPCPLFVPLAEEGWHEDEVAEAIARRYLADLPGAGVDTLVLGCTHYPLLADVISRVVGPEVTLVDSGEAVAHAVEAALLEQGLRAPADAAATHLCYVTDIPDAFGEVAARFLGGEPPEPVQVDIHV